MFINLTGTDISIIRPDGNAWATTMKLISQGEASVNRGNTTAQHINGVQVQSIASINTGGLPFSQDGVWYVVTHQVADANRHREDLLVVSSPVKQQNIIVGYTCLYKLEFAHIIPITIKEPVVEPVVEPVDEEELTSEEKQLKFERDIEGKGIASGDPEDLES